MGVVSASHHCINPMPTAEVPREGGRAPEAADKGVEQEDERPPARPEDGQEDVVLAVLRGRRYSRGKRGVGGRKGSGRRGAATEMSCRSLVGGRRGGKKVRRSGIGAGSGRGWGSGARPGKDVACVRRPPRERIDAVPLLPMTPQTAPAAPRPPPPRQHLGAEEEPG